MLIRIAGLILVLSISTSASAHHAVGARYNMDDLIEVEGEVTEVLIRNPHSQIGIRRIADNGAIENWRMATTAVSNMRRWQIDPSFVQVGDIVRVAGYLSRFDDNDLYFTNLLTANGYEVFLDRNATSIWTDQTIEMSASRRRSIGSITAPELGIFRIWSTPDNIPMLMPRNIGKTTEGRANLTSDALQAQDSYVRDRDNPLQNCTPKGMPLIMEAPYPFEMYRDGSNIIWHNEEYDTRRTIHIDTSDPGEVEPSILGYSVGVWEDEYNLIVTTTHISWGHLDGQGIPLSLSAEVVEKFSVSAQGDRLDYEITIVDPVNLVEPVSFSKHWVWYPDAEVGEYNCTIEAEN
ncbi:MAG: hypothetical protein CMM56_05240 [Rhodospirillaceae bacterium]|nr:hypothetical protein [Rhodospirillaceae bacterium]